MQTGNAIWFSSHPHPFWIDEEYHDSPDGSAREAWLTFTEIAPGKAKSKLRWFQVCVDLDTWQEQTREPVARSPQTTAWVQEFLREFPESRRAEYREDYARTKRLDRQFAEYVIEPEALRTKRLFSYSDAQTGGQSLSSGGGHFLHDFSHGGDTYLVEDLYCADPACDCGEVHLRFWGCVSREDRTFTTCFMGLWKMGGELSIAEALWRTSAEALEILQAWWDTYYWRERMFRNRYREAKAIGRRSLARMKAHPASQPVPTRPALVAAPPRAPTPLPPPLAGVDTLLSPVGVAVSGERIGRNDRCPCGSGQKFKRCCGARTAPNPR